MTVTDRAIDQLGGAVGHCRLGQPGPELHVHGHGSRHGDQPNDCRIQPGLRSQPVLSGKDGMNQEAVNCD